MTDGFEFLRPAWLLALLALPMFVFLARRGARAADAWRKAVDPHLLPHLIEPGALRGSAPGWWPAALAYALGVLALAGPSWREVEQPLWQSQAPTVIAADLSSAALAADVAPSRLARMRARIDAHLDAHAGGPIGLVAFAGDAFTVTPLTEDVANVALFVDALQPDVMPVDGQAVDRAIEWSHELMRRAGFARGHIVVLTDHADGAAQRAASAARAAGYTVSAIGLGSPDGADVRTANGASVRVALDEGSLRTLARAGGGRYSRLAADGGDGIAFRTPGGIDTATGYDGTRVRQDGGFWLVPPVMLFVLLAWMRRGASSLAAVLLAVLFVPVPARAADAFRRPDQQAHAEVMRGVEAYRRGRFEQAAGHFARVDSALAQYNRGNALARAGQLEDAVAAYDEALRRQPAMQDARANRAAVMAAMQRQGGGKGDQRNDQRGGASDRGDSRSRRPPRNDGEGQAGAGQGRAKQPPPDAAAQARADAAQRERMRKAMQKSQARPGAAMPGANRKEPEQTPQQRERKLSNDAALRRVPDEPGSLLREKFRLEHERRQREGRSP